MLLEFAGVGRVGRVGRDDFGHGDLAHVGVINGGNAAAADGRVGIEAGFDFFGENLHAGDVDEGFFPSDKGEVAVGIAHDKIAAGEKSIAQG